MFGDSLEQGRPRLGGLAQLGFWRCQNQDNAPADRFRRGGRFRTEGSKDSLAPRGADPASEQQLSVEIHNVFKRIAAPVARGLSQGVKGLPAAAQIAADQGGNEVGPSNHRLGTDPVSAAAPSANVDRTDLAPAALSTRIVGACWAADQT
jgi:hypothetical protein